jgi:hypothetical protein
MKHLLEDFTNLNPALTAIVKAITRVTVKKLRRTNTKA